jgi:hypothetical protein
MKHKLISLLGPAPITALVVAAAAASTGCKKEDPPPPLPPAQSAAATAPLQLAAMDAAVEEIDAGAPKKIGKGGGGRGGLKPCCAALKQNANLAPEPTKTYMLQAAAMCDAAAASGQGMQSALGMIAGALRGAQMPANCK